MFLATEKSTQRYFSAFLLLVIMFITSLQAGETGPEEISEGNAWRFKVFLDDKEIGYHNFYVAEHKGVKQLKSEANFEYKLLFLRLFHYQHENSETWTGDCLQSINSRTNSNGEPFRVDGRLEGGQFRVDSNGGEVSLPECVMSFAYWNPKFLEQSSLLNTQDGEFLEVDISNPVFEELEVLGESRPSYRYRLAAGALNLDLWYSTSNDWLALESEVQGGRKLRYERM